MKASIFSLALAATVAQAHTIFYSLEVNGKDQGSLNGVRAPSSNQYVSDVSSASLACNTNLQSPVSSAVIDVVPGDKITTVWGHVIGGAQYSGDSDNPIAASHKGPIQMYMAKVADASTSDGSGLKWFKVASEGLSGGKWGVDTLIAGGGKWSFDLPNVAAGQYLLRGEVIALHSAYDVGAAQFYMSCAALNVGGSGTCAPTDTVSFPGAYSSTDAGIKISIYGNTGAPDNGGKAYVAPGPSVISCGGSSAPAPAPAPAPASSSVAALPATTAAAPATTAASSASAPVVATPTTLATSAVAPASTTSASASATSAAAPAPSAPADGGDDECDADYDDYE